MTNYKLLCKYYHQVETLDWLLIFNLFLLRMTQGRTMGSMSLHAKWFIHAKLLLV